MYRKVRLSLPKFELDSRAGMEADTPSGRAGVERALVGVALQSGRVEREQYRLLKLLRSTMGRSGYASMIRILGATSAPGRGRSASARTPDYLELQLRLAHGRIQPEELPATPDTTDAEVPKRSSER